MSKDIYTRSNMIDYIYNNFKYGKKKLTKKYLNEQETHTLKTIIIANKCEDKFEKWVNRPKLINYLIEGIQNGERYSYECKAENEESCKKLLEKDGIKVELIVKKNRNHKCGYCGAIVKGRDKDILCSVCREDFGHTYIWEL